MKFSTQIISPSTKNLRLTAEAILQGECIGLPTETVYGLAADATNPDAVRKIYKIKNRPTDNPVIVHIASWQQLKSIATLSPLALKLARAFWPGPLTILVPKTPTIPGITTAQTPYVAVRWPQHPVAIELIKLTQRPLAAPSANLSGSLSPTTAEHVLADLAGQIPYILDGGPAITGLESTFVDCRTDEVSILRPGAISASNISKVIGKQVALHVDPVLVTPGAKHLHYRPHTPLLLFTTTLSLNHYLDRHPNQKFAYLGTHKHSAHNIVAQYAFPTKLKFAANLYAALRALDEQPADAILVLPPNLKGIGAAIYDRLSRAAHKIYP